ncbi:MAG: hypothetical protein Q8R18_00840 [bacterium]|nr:hypothetical protein [bacterium]
MYKHDLTKEEEYPRTVREVLHHSLTLLCEQFPERVILRQQKENGWLMSSAAYSWPGAGSEKGGSSEHIRYEKVVLLPEREGKVSVVSVGDKQFDHMHTVLIHDDDGGLHDLDSRSLSQPSYYSVLFREYISSGLAEELLSYYHAHIKDKQEKSYDFTFALEDGILDSGTSSFCAVPLFAVDRRQGPGVYLLNKYGSVQNFGSDVERFFPESWDDRFKGNVEDRVKVSHFFADFLLGNVDSPLYDARLARKRGRDFDVLDASDEEKALVHLRKAVV